VEVSFLDVAARAPAPAELRRFSERLGARALIDEDGRAFRDQGLAYLRMDDAEIVDRVRADVRLLRLPLVRMGDRVSAGPAEAEWRSWLAAP
jgi:arsenate reductase-like glutaredoxin family protein